MKDYADAGANQQRHNRGRHTFGKARQNQQNNQRTCAQSQRRWGKTAPVRDKQLDAGQKFAGNRTGLESEKILDLSRGNQNCDAVGKADHHHARNEAHRRAQPGKAHDDQQHTRHQRHHG